MEGTRDARLDPVQEDRQVGRVNGATGQVRVLDNVLGECRSRLTSVADRLLGVTPAGETGPTDGKGCCEVDNLMTSLNDARDTASDIMHQIERLEAL